MGTIGFPIKYVILKRIALPDNNITHTGIPIPIPRHPKVKDKMPTVSE